MEALDPVTSEPALTDVVHHRLVEAISAGRLRPGERLTQDRVAKLLDVSRQPVSHALQLLKHQGLVVQHGRMGLAVAPMDGAQIRQLYQVRGALDGLAARLAALRVRDGRALASELDALRAALDTGTAIGADAETIVLVRADVAFHRALHDLSGNPAIARTVAEQWPQLMRSMAVVLDGREHKAVVWTEHAAIADPVLSGEPDEAERRAREHAERAGEETGHRLGAPADTARERSDGNSNTRNDA